MFDLIIGCGQGGSRLAKAISDVFKVPGRYINLAEVDYAAFDVCDAHKLVIDGDGTGRSAKLGEAIARRNFDLIRMFIDNSISYCGEDRVCVCIGGGGGSGTGLMFPILEHLISVYKKMDILLLYTLPRKLEGLPAKPQALTYLNRLVQYYMTGRRQVATIIIDNEYVTGIYCEDSGDEYEYWVRVNRGVAESLRAFYNLTRIDQVAHIDAASGFGALDYNELLSVLFFKNGFVDIRDFEMAYPDADIVPGLLRANSRVFKDLDVRTCKAYIVALALPDQWKGHRETGEFVDAVFAAAAKATRTTYVLRSSFYSRRLCRARILLLYAGLTKGRGLDRIIKQTAKDVDKFSQKAGVAAFDLSQIISKKRKPV